MSRRGSRWIAPDDAPPAGWRATVADVAIVLALTSVVVSIAAHAPSHTYAYAQINNIGAGVGMLESGNWVLPRNQFGRLASKPQLFPWMLAAACGITGVYDDFVFRLPTILAALAMGVMVYLLARRWYGRQTGLLAACLWVGIFHQIKLMYVSTTDMLLALWITVAVFCLDRLVFHRATSNRRPLWAAALWGAMILAAMTKGWGLVNVTLVGLFIALAAALRPGFGALRRADSAGGKLALATRLIRRRIRTAIRETRFLCGMLALTAVVGAIFVAMFLDDADGMKQVLYFEVWQRITGVGASPPASSTAPAIACLIYYALPTSVLAISALLLTAGAADRAAPLAMRRSLRRTFRAACEFTTAVLRKWFSRKSPVSLPLCWVLAVLVPFSLAYGFRPDYLLPCYPAVAMLAALAIADLSARGRTGGRFTSFIRHLCAAAPVVIGAALVLIPPIYLFHDHMPGFVQKAFSAPYVLRPETRWILGALIPAGVVIFVSAVRASLRWRIRRLAILTVLGMLGVMFLYTHTFSRYAQAGEGQKMREFSHRARRLIGDDEFLVFGGCSGGVEELAVELYLGRFGRKVHYAEQIEADGARWLITTERGLRYLPQRVGQSKRRLTGSVGYTHAELGELLAKSPPIRTEKNWGAMVLIRLPAHK